MELTREVRDKRVAVARDILAQIATKRLTFAPGAYLESDEPLYAVPRDTDGDLGPYAPRFREKCQVCMLGAALLSKAELYDGVPLSRFAVHGASGFSAPGWNVRECLLDVFDQRTLDLMESAFEAGPMGLTPDDDEKFVAVEFGTNFATSERDEYGDRAYDSEACAAAIAQLLIDGDGELIFPTVASAPTP